jgi:dihydrofolate reductase
MRKLVLFLHASLDGFVEGPNGEMDIGWISYVNGIMPSGSKRQPKSFFPRRWRKSNGTIPDWFKNLKQQPGKDMVILGSPRFAHYLMQLDLIDEYKITVSPVLIDSGLPLFQGLKEKINLKLIENKTFDSGAIGLVYQTVR